jgi:ornithine carbamoyltransferase
MDFQNEEIKEVVSKARKVKRKARKEDAQKTQRIVF